MIQKRALHFMYDDYSSSYEELLLKADKPIIEVRKLRIMSVEIFKTLNNLNPIYMKEIFTLNTRESSKSNTLKVKAQNSKKVWHQFFFLFTRVLWR
jgi:hypothetical protein